MSLLISFISQIPSWIPSSGILSVLLTAVLGFYTNKKLKIADSDKKRYQFLSEFYFFAVDDVFGDEIPVTDAKYHLNLLIQHLLFYKEDSVLLSQHSIKLLKRFKNSPIERHVKDVQKQLRRDFRLSRIKMGYYSSNKILVIRWICLFYFTFFLFLFIFFLILVMYTSIIEKGFDMDLLSLPFGVLSMATVLFSFLLHRLVQTCYILK